TAKGCPSSVQFESKVFEVSSQSQPEYFTATLWPFSTSAPSPSMVVYVCSLLGLSPLGFEIDGAPSPAQSTAPGLSDWSVFSPSARVSGFVVFSTSMT